MEIKKASLNNIDYMMTLFEEAKVFMREHGNPDQWPDDYPSREMIEEDMDHMYLCMHEDQIAAIFYFAIEEDEDYKDIEGKWLNNKPYGVVHRVVSAHVVKGAARFILDWAYHQIPNIRMDTGIKNIPMQHLLESSGFKKCGLIKHIGTIDCFAYQKGEEDEI